ncbi:MAG: hypothetical protein K8E24_012815 [Methanobacterium paludis]|nr:hypothetical protein [Methanobacterium paludis]
MQKRTINKILIVFILAIVVIFVASFIGASSEKTYNNSGISFNYPSSFSVDENSTDSSIILTDNSNLLYVDVLTSKDEGETLVKNFDNDGTLKNNETGIVYSKYSSNQDGRTSTAYLFQKGNNTYLLRQYNAGFEDTGSLDVILKTIS